MKRPRSSLGFNHSLQISLWVPQGKLTVGNKLTFNRHRYHIFCLVFFLRFYLLMRNTQRQKHREREKQAPWKEPDVGLNPRTPGSCPEPNVDAQPLNHPGAPLYPFQGVRFYQEELQNFLLTGLLLPAKGKRISIAGNTVLSSTIASSHMQLLFKWKYNSHIIK